MSVCLQNIVQIHDRVHFHNTVQTYTNFNANIRQPRFLHIIYKDISLVICTLRIWIEQYADTVCDSCINNISSTSQEHVKNMPRTCQEYAINTSKACLEHVMSGSPAGVVGVDGLGWGAAPPRRLRGLLRRVRHTGRAALRDGHWQHVPQGMQRIQAVLPTSYSTSNDATSHKVRDEYWCHFSQGTRRVMMPLPTRYATSTDATSHKVRDE